MTELLPCPFCGGDAAIYMEPDTIESGEINAMCISGEACHARLYRSIYNPQQPRKNAYDWQFKQWNTRPIEAALQSQIDRLTKERDDWKNAAHTLYDHSGAGEGSEAHATYHNAIKQWGE